MQKAIPGVLGALVAVVVFLYGLGSTSEGATDPWIFQKIPAIWFLNYQIPRIFVLGFSAFWFFGGIGAIINGLSDAGSVNRFEELLKEGKTPLEILVADLDLSDSAVDPFVVTAQHLVRGTAYSEAVTEISRRTGKPLEQAVWTYKLMVDTLNGKAKLIHEAAQRVGLADPQRVEFSLPSVRVVEPPKLSFKEKMLKVDMSEPHANRVLTQGDLIVAYNGRLIGSLDDLRAACAVTGSKEVRVDVLRLSVKHHHPITGFGADSSWITVQFPIPGGPLDAKLEQVGEAAKGSSIPLESPFSDVPAATPVTPAPLGGTAPQPAIPTSPPQLGATPVATKLEINNEAIAERLVGLARQWDASGDPADVREKTRQQVRYIGQKLHENGGRERMAMIAARAQALGASRSTIDQLWSDIAG